jgi:hypothetical protein
VTEPHSRRRLATPPVTFALFLASLCVVTALIAYYDVFSTFQAYDDARNEVFRRVAARECIPTSAAGHGVAAEIQSAFRLGV